MQFDLESTLSEKEIFFPPQKKNFEIAIFGFSQLPLKGLFDSLPDDKFLDWSKLKQIADDILTLSQTSPGFYVCAVQVFLKTLREKEKLLVTSNFSFSHSVFYPSGELSAIFVKFKIVVCKFFQFGRV